PLVGGLGASQQLVAAQQVVARDFGLGDFRLRAVVAVLGAQAALGVHQEVELHRAAEVTAPHGEPGGQEVHQLVVWGGEDGQRVVGRERVAVEDAIGQVVPGSGRAGGRFEQVHRVGPSDYWTRR